MYPEIVHVTTPRVPTGAYRASSYLVPQLLRWKVFTIWWPCSFI